MYSRYVPGTDGCHEKRPVRPSPPKEPCRPGAPVCPPVQKEPPACGCVPEKPGKKLPGFLDKLLPEGMELGDILVLLILLLVLLDSEEDSLSLLLAIGLFFFMK